MPKIQESVISFFKNGEPMEFTVYNNLPEFGLDILAAFHNWTVRTDEFTEQSFCQYVMSKDPQIRCLTKEQYHNLQ